MAEQAGGSALPGRGSGVICAPLIPPPIETSALRSLILQKPVIERRIRAGIRPGIIIVARRNRELDIAPPRLSTHPPFAGPDPWR
jgi:hypothetical protein